MSKKKKGVPVDEETAQILEDHGWIDDPAEDAPAEPPAAPETVNIVVNTNFNQYSRGDKLVVAHDETTQRWIDQGMWSIDE